MGNTGGLPERKRRMIMNNAAFVTYQRGKDTYHGAMISITLGLIPHHLFERFRFGALEGRGSYPAKH
jgi:hypothetical protein